MDLEIFFARPPPAVNRAARDGDLGVLRELLSTGKRPDLTDHRGWSALHEAAAADQLECVNVLLQDAHSSPKQLTHMGLTPLELAIEHKASLAVVKVLLSHTGLLPSLIHKACLKGKLDIVKWLLGAGARLYIHEMENHETPLHCAVRGNNMDVVSYLLSCGAKPHVVDYRKCTPLFVAVEQQSLECAQVLINSGAKVNYPTWDGVTPLMMACQKGHLEMVKFLLSSGADSNIVADDYSMAITYAVHDGHTEIVQLLIPLLSHEKLRDVAKNPNPTRVSLYCFALDSESEQCLNLLLESCLPDELKEWPIYCRQKGIRPHIKYDRKPPISFLLKDKMCEYGDRIVIVLDRLIRNGFPVNVKETNQLPPLVAALLYPLLQPPPGQLAVLERLIEAGAEVDYRSQSCNMLPDAILAASLKCNGPALKTLLPYSTVSPHQLLEYFIEGKSTIFCYFLMAEASLGDDFTGLAAKVAALVDRNSPNCRWLTFLPRLKECFPSLQGIARRKVREYLCKNSCNTQIFIQKIERLAVPNIIKDYLRFKI